MYFVIPFVDAQEIQNIDLSVNGVQLPLSSTAHWAIQSMKKGCYYCDITEIIQMNSSNSVQLHIGYAPSHMFMGGYLVYPVAEATTEVTVVIPDEAETVCISLSNPPIYQTKDVSGVRILSAQWSEPCFAEHTKVKLAVKLNKVAEEVKKVICSCPITIDSYSQLTMNTDRELAYDPELDIWSVDFIIGDRKMLIMDDANVHIRAVDVENMADTCVLPIQWKYLS